MEINPDFLAPCGLYCGVCGVYYATRDNNMRFMERLVSVYKGNIPDSENLTVDDILCNGCLSDNNVCIFCRWCSIKDCTREKGYEGCHQCDDFPCQFIDSFPMPVGKKVIMRAIPYWRRFDLQMMVLACSLTRCNAGMSIDMSRAIMAMTTSSSINVNAFLQNMVVYFARLALPSHGRPAVSVFCFFCFESHVSPAS